MSNRGILDHHRTLHMPVAINSLYSSVDYQNNGPTFASEKLIGPAAHVILQKIGIRRTSSLSARLNYPTSK